MKKGIKKAVSLILVAVVFLASAPLAGFVGLDLPEINLFSTKAFAATSGTCGANLTWSFDKSTGELSISGTGGMDNLQNSPWKDLKATIKKVTISEGVTSIGSSAFSGLTVLSEITIPKSIKTMGNSAFSNCSNLRDVYFGGGISEWMEISFDYYNDYIVSNPMYYAQNIYFNGSLVTDLAIPSGTEKIKSATFYGFTNLKSVTIPDSVTSIGSYAFYNCTSLASIEIPDSVTTIGYCAFSKCTSFVSVTIPDSVTSIGNSAFSNCTSLASVEIPDSVTSIGEYAFRDCESLASVEIPDSVISIGNYAFYSCDSLASIEIPDSVTSIGNDAFSNCKSLVSVEIPDSVTTIGNYAFSYCTSLASIEIPDSVISIGEYAFRDCESLASVEIPDSVTTIGNSAFYNCTSLVSVEIPDSVTTIGEGAFYNCTSLASVEISDSVTSIGGSAFSYCTSLASVEIPDSVTSIGGYAFSYCRSLESVVIPDSVTSIAGHSFYNCTSLENVYYEGDASDWLGIAFSNEYSNPMCYAKTLYFNGEAVTDIVVPDGVTSIGAYQFYNLSQLDSITIPDSVASFGVSSIPSNALIICNEGSYAYEYAVKNSFAYYLLGWSSEEGKITGKIGTKLTWEIDRRERKLTVDNNGAMVSFVAETAPWKQYAQYILSAEVNHGCTNVSSYAFSNLPYLRSVEIPFSVTSIDSNAFYNCTSLASVEIPDSVTNIGDSAFYNCTSLVSVEIPDSVTSIGEDAFSNCRSLASVEIPDSVTSIGSYAFYNCTSLASVEIPDSVTYLGDRAFYDCDSLENAVLGNGLTQIEGCMFASCNNLKTVTIGSGVTYIGYDVFEYCNNLETVYYAGDVAGWLRLSFYSYSSYVNPMYYAEKLYIGGELVTDLVIPDGVSSIRKDAFVNCTNLRSVTVSDSVTTINGSAFKNCDSLETVTIGSGIKTISDYVFANCPSLKDVYIYGTNCSISESSISIYATIHGYVGSTAEAFATKYGYEFIPIVDNPCAEHTYTNSCDVFCDVCNAKRETSHSFGEWAVTKEPTCVARGMKERVCSVCGTTEKYAVAKSDNHVYSNSCDASCDLCGKTRDYSHSFGEWAVTKEPTCDKFGVRKRTCSECGATETDSVAKLTEHTYTDTCDTECNVCGKTREINHTYGGWVITKESTCAETGVKERVCSVCGNVETDSVAKLTTHVYANLCDENCDLCGAVRVVNHVYGDWVVKTEPTCSAEGLKERICSVSGCIERESIETVHHTDEDYDSYCDDCQKLVGNNGAREGICGKNLTWAIDDYGVLTIKGTGAMYDFGNGDYVAVDPETNEQLSEETDGSVSVCRWNRHFDKIKEVVISSSVESISAYAFSGCRNLEKVYIPDIVISIDELAFDGCGKVAIVCKNGSYAHVFAAQNGIKYILENSESAFEIRNDMLISYNGTAQNVVVPADVASIGIGAFASDNTVKFIELPFSVSKIHARAFANCGSLGGVVVPFTVTDISSSAFSGTNAKIYCYNNSYAHNFAVRNGIAYELITVTLSTNAISLDEGEMLTVNAVPSITLASGIPLIWKSENTAIASVDATGTVVAKAVGNTTVGVYSPDGNLLAECDVTVGSDAVKEIALEEASTDTLKYGEKLILHVNVANLTEGASIRWSSSNESILKISNENALCTSHADCVTCTVESVGNGDAAISATVVDENGNPIIMDGEEITTSYTMTSKAGFFQKLIAFFKKLFGLTKTIPELYKGIF